MQLLDINNLDCGLDGSDGNGANGGVERAYIADCNVVDWSAISFDTGNTAEITLLPLLPGYVWAELSLSEDGTSYFNQRYTKQYKRVAQEGMVFIDGLNPNNRNGLNLINSRCCLVVVYVYENGYAACQGVRRYFKQNLFRAAPSLVKPSVSESTFNSNNSDTQSKISITFQSVDREISIVFPNYKTVMGI